MVKTDGEMPDWFRNGVEAALLAPTAMNQQKFLFTLKENKVYAKAGIGFYTKVYLGEKRIFTEVHCFYGNGLLTA
ncbi:MAG: nitroreductase family protein [Lachnospiraceae bacterium]